MSTSQHPDGHTGNYKAVVENSEKNEGSGPSLKSRYDRLSKSAVAHDCVESSPDKLRLPCWKRQDNEQPNCPTGGYASNSN